MVQNYLMKIYENIDGRINDSLYLGSLGHIYVAKINVWAIKNIMNVNVKQNANKSSVFG